MDTAIIQTTATIISLAVVLILRDMRDGKSIFKKNGAYETRQAIGQILISQKELQHHYNDETTECLKELSRHSIRHTQMLEEIIKYGIKCRDAND